MLNINVDSVLNFLDNNELARKYNVGEILKNINLELNTGDFISIQGKSGSGKTTLLNILGLLDSPTSGEVIYDSINVDFKKENLKNTLRNEKIGFVFQFHYLLPEFSALENVMLPALVRKKADKEIVRKKAEDYLNMVGLGGRLTHKPSELSGGEKQRVAIARALIGKPDILLLDEPLSALDAKLRQKLLIELDTIHDEVGITFIFVTHDQTEALSVSDRIAIMNKGEILQIGTPNEIYESPENAFVADFIGETNFLSGKVTEVHEKHGYIETPILGRMKIELDKPVKVGDTVVLTLRPEKIKISNNRPNFLHDNYNILHGMIEEVIYTGFQSKLFVKVENSENLIKVFNPHVEYLVEEEIYEWKEEVYIFWNYEDAYLVEVK